MWATIVSQHAGSRALRNRLWPARVRLKADRPEAEARRKKTNLPGHDGTGDGTRSPEHTGCPEPKQQVYQTVVYKSPQGWHQEGSNTSEKIGRNGKQGDFWSSSVGGNGRLQWVQPAAGKARAGPGSYTPDPPTREKPGGKIVKVKGMHKNGSRANLRRDDDDIQHKERTPAR